MLQQKPAIHHVEPGIGLEGARVANPELSAVMTSRRSSLASDRQLLGIHVDSDCAARRHDSSGEF
jgi:hypothetical protein